jgi:NADH:ubiquinone oxidoreductase subunit F (NADH-binding)
VTFFAHESCGQCSPCRERTGRVRPHHAPHHRRQGPPS